MVWLRIILALGALALAGAIFWAIPQSGAFGDEIVKLASNPWGLVSLIDLYLGFLIMAAVVFLFERKLLVACLWALPTFALGNIWSAAWLIWRAPVLAERLRATVRPGEGRPG